MLELNWHERIGEKHVISRRSRIRTAAKCATMKNARAKRVNVLSLSWLNMQSYDALSTVGEWGGRDCKAF